MPAVALAFVAVTALVPLLLASALLVDLWRWLRERRRWMAVRMLAFGWVYLVGQVIGMVWLFLIWVASGFGRAERRLVLSTYRVQRVWARMLFSAVRRIFALGLDVEGSEDADHPAVFMPRHASLIDTLLPSVLITSGHGVRLRYVLKKELLLDPALDVAGNRLPNYFVDRASRRTGDEIDGVRSLAQGMADDEGLLIYPEGTRYRPERQSSLVRRLRRRPELHAVAQRLRRVHPPRLGGPVALLDAGLDVVFVAHAGLDGFARVKDIWRGDLVGASVRVSFRRVPHAEVPSGREDRARWLFEEWEKVDAEVVRLEGITHGA